VSLTRSPDRQRDFNFLSTRKHCGGAVDQRRLESLAKRQGKNGFHPYGEEIAYLLAENYPIVGLALTVQGRGREDANSQDEMGEGFTRKGRVIRSSGKYDTLIRRLTCHGKPGESNW